MKVPYYTIDDFLREMAPFNLSYRAPRTNNEFFSRQMQYLPPFNLPFLGLTATTTNKLWVFWSQKEGEEGGGEGGDLNNNGTNVQECLKYLLCNTEYTREKVALIQFWAPTTISSTIGGRSVLKTSNERGVCEYRKYCASLEFNIFQDGEKEYDVEFGSVIG